MPAFEARPSQREMAKETAKILVDGGVLLAEAGTGTGKTLAYLVPAILSNQQVLISTGTKNLQDQIYYKDLPALREALDIDVRATYMRVETITSAYIVSRHEKRKSLVSH